MKVVAVHRLHTTAGIAPYVDREISALASLGCDVVPFGLRIRTLRELGLETCRLRRAVVQQSADVVHAHFGDMVGFAGALASLGLARMVVTFRGSDLNPAPSVPRLRLRAGHALSHVAAALADGIICVSQELRGRLLWGRARAIVIPTGVPTDLFFPRGAEKCRSELGWPAGEPVVLMNAGPAPAKKRIDLAQRAIAKARTASPSLGLLRLVTLDGTVPPQRVATMLNAAHCLLICSDFEGSPTILQEAMACNTPIVATKAGDAAEQLAGLEACEVVDQDIDAMAAALARVVTSNRRSTGVQRARQVLDCRVIARRVLDVLAGATPPARGRA